MPEPDTQKRYNHDDEQQADQPRMAQEPKGSEGSVSYTHLTLPTIYSV